MRLLRRKECQPVPDVLDDDPMSLAEAYERSLRPGDRPADDAPQVLWRFREVYYWWDGAGYRSVTDPQVRNDLYRFLRGLTLRNPKVVGNYKCRPDSNLVSKVLDALHSVCESPATHMPCSLDPDVVPDDTVILAFRNGLLDVGRYLTDGDATLLPPNPAWFSETVFPHDFDPGATCPKWEKFLTDVLGAEDAEGSGGQRDLLQEWVGYLLTPDMSQQKFMLMVGRPRSGKGTVLRAIRRLVGTENCAAPSLRSLAKPFGLHPLLGKTVAICGDAHLGRADDAVGILETIKTITGEDAVDVDRKHLPAVTNCQLGVRFTVAVNEELSLPDASSALVTRLLTLKFARTFAGREDRTLDRQLAAEVAGIVLWALRGLGRLRDSGSFTETDVAGEMLRQIARSGSPVRAFVEDRCVTADNLAEYPTMKLEDLSVPVDRLFEAWTAFARENGHHQGSKETLGRKLGQVVPQLERRRLWAGGDREWTYYGIALPLIIP